MRSKNQLIAAALTAASLTTFGIAQESRKPEEPKELYLYFSRSAVYNHSVGNDFSCAYTLDGEKISSGQIITDKAGETIAVRVELTEQDKHPDTSLVLGQEYFCSSFSTGFNANFYLSI